MMREVYLNYSESRPFHGGGRGPAALCLPGLMPRGRGAASVPGTSDLAAADRDWVAP